MNLKVVFATGLLGVAGSVGISAPASATLIDVIYKGVVKDGADGIGLFGPAGADLTGYAFVATFEMDTSKGHNRSTATENLIEGGTVYSVDSPMIQRRLRINGMSHTIDGSENGTVQSALEDPGLDNFQAHVAYDASGNMIDLSVIDAKFASVGNIPFTIDVPLDFVFTSSEIGQGGATFRSGGLGTGFDFSPTELIYQYPSTDGGGGAVAEPSTWALMLLGFVGIAAFGYRRAERSRLQNWVDLIELIPSYFSIVDFHPERLCSAASGRLRPPCFCCVRTYSSVLGRRLALAPAITASSSDRGPRCADGFNLRSGHRPTLSDLHARARPA
jgi:hypothetical protein